jgi:protein gp37
VWIGVTVENAKAKHRIDTLRDVRAAVRFLSCEPLIGPLGEIDLEDIDWVIAGGESGPNARRMDIDWVREIRDWCHAWPEKVPFFFKQFGRPENNPLYTNPPPGMTGATWMALSNDTVGKGGSLIDGKAWKEWPRCYNSGADRLL